MIRASSTDTSRENSLNNNSTIYCINDTSMLEQLPLAVQRKLFSYLPLEDLICMIQAYSNLASLIRNYICANRTVGFTVASQVINDRSRRSGWLGFLAGFRPRSRHILKCSLSLRTDVICVHDSLAGWNKLWKETILSNLVSYPNLKRLGLRGIGSDGGGVLLTLKTLKKLSEVLPNLETLSFFSCVFMHPRHKYFAPIGTFKQVSGHFNWCLDDDNFSVNSGAALKNLQFPVFPKVKTLRIDQTELDFIVRPEVFPNLERMFLFLATDGYFPGKILSRYSERGDSKLSLFTYGPKNRADLKWLPVENPVEGTNSGDSGEQLLKFLQTHQDTLETFFWQPFPPEITGDVVKLILRMKQLKRFAICQPEYCDDGAPETILRKIQVHMSRSPLLQCTDSRQQQIRSENILCRNLEYLFLGCDTLPDTIVRGLIGQNSWTLKTVKLWDCSTLTPETLELLSRCQCLETLVFTCVGSLTIETLEKILSRRAGALKILVLQKCPKLRKDDAAVLVKNYCQNLQQFHFSSVNF